MTQDNHPINSHIEEYLDYYCKLSHAPGFAVLLKGQWGAGKTWFIKKYCEKLKENKKKCLYISLYGMTSFSEIEYAFFQQLHPVLSSKGMAITGKIFKGLLRGTLKIDLNHDNKNDGTWNIQIPDINLPEYLKNADQSILIFDDLERCKIELSNILGYINYFVEHQDLKMVIVANENELLKNDSYKLFKEKLIGKTFSICLDFEKALENFVAGTNNSDASKFLSANFLLIKDLYKEVEYENSRTLKQVILDFERIFNELPEQAKTNTDLLQDLLKMLIVFSIEIKRGTVLPTNITQLKSLQDFAREDYISRTQQAYNSESQENGEQQTSLRKICEKYLKLNLYLWNPFPSKVWWQTFFDKGLLDGEELKRALSTSKYFQDENTPTWVRLWYYPYLTDVEFENSLKKVELEYDSKQFMEIGVVKHVTGLFLMFSEAGLYNKSKQDIIKDAKLYIDRLSQISQLDFLSQDTSLSEPVFRGLGFQGTEIKEFQDFCLYIKEVQELVRVKRRPSDAQELLTNMQSNFRKFYEMICLGDSQNTNESEPIYYEIPILKYIEPAKFVAKFLPMKFEDKQHIGWALSKRYKFDHVNKKLLEELEWLKSVRTLLLKEASHSEGKLSGHLLKVLVKDKLDEAIKKLEKSRSQIDKA